MRSGRVVRAATLSAVVYAALAALIGIDVLGSLAHVVANDEGDPLLTAAILTWNAEHVPYTDAWWQFPIFDPTADALAFSEHILGLSVLATPLYWLTGNTLVTYNVTLLLTYPLCGLAMYAFVRRLTGSTAAAFLAGLAYAFAPVRASQLPHIQLLAMFYLPLVLLGLHGFLETGRRRWLALSAAAWALQGAVSGYFLIYGSVLVGGWLLWFVVAPRRWRDLGWIAAAFAAAALPLAPLLLRYSEVHARHGFTRNFGETATFGADIASLLCAPAGLTVWGALRVGCKPEGELFPGAALVALCVFGAAMAWRSRTAEPPVDRRWAATACRVLIAVAAVFAIIGLSAALLGPWRLELGPVRASVSSAMKPLSSSLYLLGGAVLLSAPVAAAVRRASVPLFYLAAALGSWVLSWGPEPTLLGERALYQPPFAWLMLLPGGTALRVPGRFWLIAMTCLVVLMAVLLARVLDRRRRRLHAALVTAAAIALAADGWMRIATKPEPAAAPRPDLLRGHSVAELPIGSTLEDIAAVYRAVTGGWRTVNGFSGYEPATYPALRAASKAGDPALLSLLGRGERHLLVGEHDTDLRAIVERHPGAELVGRANGLVQYRVPADGASSGGGGR